MNIRTLLVDDEDLARSGLRGGLARAPDVTIVGECANGLQAIEAIDRLAPDLVFLDVQMPEGSGFEVIKAIRAESAPYIIFVTAYDQYAVQAFEVRALDYLLKPVDERRLLAALVQVRAALLGGRKGISTRQRHGLAGLSGTCSPSGPVSAGAPIIPNTPTSSTSPSSLSSPLGSNSPSGSVSLGSPGGASPEAASLERIAVPNGDRVAVLRTADIDWVGAAGNYVSLHSDKKEWLLRETIAMLEQRLAPQGFVRIHRSTLVNVDRVSELRALGSGDFGVMLRDGTELKMSRNYRASLWGVLGGGGKSAELKPSGTPIAKVRT